MAPKKTIFVIESFEKPSGGWLALEYASSAGISGKGDLLITGTGKIKGLRTERKHSWQLGLPDPMILDPAAAEVLEPEDFCEAAGDNHVVIGGILGDWPPRARTGPLLSSRFPGARLRSLGGLQLSIDNAVFVAKRISEGKRLSEIPFVQQAEIRLGKDEAVKLNFGYPLVNGRPRITPGLKALLEKRRRF